MCFGLGSAPATYIRLMNIITSGIDNVFCYLDDILIYSSTLEEHEETLNTLLKRFSYHGLELNLKKCTFAKQEVNYLGFKLMPHGYEKQQRLVKPMMEATLPTTLTEARALCSLFSYYRHFIKNFSKIAAPLLQLTKGHPIGKG